MKPQIQLVAIDLDGTLLKNDKTISDPSVNAIKRCVENSIAIVIATTRSLSFVRPICQKLGLLDPVICATGAEVWETGNGPLWIRHTIPLHVAQAVATLADENNWFLSTTIESVRYWRRRPDQDHKSIPSNVQLVNNNLEAMYKAPTKILTKDPNAITAIDELCKRRFPDQCRTEIFYPPIGDAQSIVVVSKNADKGQSLQVILDRLHIGNQHVMALGDNGNDIPMFRKSGLAVAMGNALDTIKSEATTVTDTNENDGVAKAIERYVLHSG